MTYAKGTEVPVSRSRSEIIDLLRKHGADQVVTGSDYGQSREVVAFRIEQRQVRITLPLPSMTEFRLTPTGRRRTDIQQRDAFAQEERRRWRALAFIIKAKLTAVQDGISTVEREFLADVVLPDGQTLSEWVGPQLVRAYTSAEMPALMPGGRS